MTQDEDYTTMKEDYPTLYKSLCFVMGLMGIAIMICLGVLIKGIVRLIG